MPVDRTEKLSALVDSKLVTLGAVGIDVAMTVPPVSIAVIVAVVVYSAGLDVTMTVSTVSVAVVVAVVVYCAIALRQVLLDVPGSQEPHSGLIVAQSLKLLLQPILFPIFKFRLQHPMV